MSAIHSATSTQSTPQITQVTISQDAIEQAILEFMVFVKTPSFEKIAGPISNLAEALQGIFSDSKEDPKIAFKYSGKLISEILQQSEEDGLLDKNIGIVFFAMERDQQISFVNDISKKIISYASWKERRERNVRAKAKEIKDAAFIIHCQLGKDGTKKLAASMIHP